MSANDGGPAFPCPDAADGTPWNWDGKHGMSLRAWLAGQALTGLLAGRSAAAEGQEHFYARMAVKIANAMLAELEKPRA